MVCTFIKFLLGSKRYQSTTIDQWNRTTKPSDWDNPSTKKDFLDFAAKDLNIKDIRDWYRVTSKDLERLGGSSLLRSKYKASPSLLIPSVFPDHEWLPWKFQKVPTNYWSDVNNQIKFVKWAGKELNIRDMSDWYNVSHKLLQTVFPNYGWELWKFEKANNVWSDVDMQKKFVDMVAKKLDIKEMTDWYNDFGNIGGLSMLKHKYNGSPYLLLSAIYQDYDWLPWKFKSVPKNFWNADANKRKFLDWVGDQLGHTSLDDWDTDIINYGGYTLLSNNNFSLNYTLMQAYPELATKIKDKIKSQRKSQALLKSMLKTMFPTEEVLEEYKHPDLLVSSGRPLELDFFYPQLKLALEYQGVQHYRNVTRFHNKSSTEEDQVRDTQKGALCASLGIALIEVPYWWDQKYASLKASVYIKRPDLFTEIPTENPIPLSPPNKPKTKHPDSIAAKQALMTATEWSTATMDPTGWWISEKYDGMRLYWTGTEFYTRQGKKVKAPDFIVNNLPHEALDGELWTKNGLFQEAVALVRRKRHEEKWKDAVFWVFDAPDMIDKPYEERMDHLMELKEQGMFPSFVKLVSSVKCESKEHLKEFFESIVSKGGEGVMLREPQSLYKSGRSESMRKFKPFFDTEVKVVEINYPHGFNCVQMNGKSVFIGINEINEEAKRVKVGSVITVKHLGTNVYGTLQYPKFYRERNDVTWEELINI